MKGAFLPPPKPARILKPIQLLSCIHVYDGHESNRCLEIEKKIQPPIGTGSNPFVDQHKQMVLAPVKFV